MRKAVSILGLLVGLLVMLAVPTAGVAGPPPISHLQNGDETCITCHTNQETLQALAEEPEEEEELSEGEG